MVILFNLLQNHQTVFQHSCTILHSHQQHVQVLISPYPYQHSFFSFKNTVAILVGVHWLQSVGIRVSCPQSKTDEENLTKVMNQSTFFWRHFSMGLNCIPLIWKRLSLKTYLCLDASVTRKKMVHILDEMPSEWISLWLREIRIWFFPSLILTKQNLALGKAGTYHLD